MTSRSTLQTFDTTIPPYIPNWDVRIIPSWYIQVKEGCAIFRLKELRVDNDMSQTELAEKLNLKASAISKYEKGITQPSIDTLKNLAEIFSVTVDYLIGMSDIKNPYSNSQITPNEADLIEHFRQLTYENKIRIDERIKTMAEA